MSIQIRLMGADATELDAVEYAIRTVLDVPAPGRDYPSRRPDDPTVRRYLETTARAAKRGTR